MTEQGDLLQLAELFDCLEEVVVWVKDRHGVYCWVNRTFRMNLEREGGPTSDGGGADGVIGKTDYDLSPAFLADQYGLDDEHVLAGNRIVNRIELVTQPDGTNGWNITNKIPLFDSRGKTIGTAGLTRPLKATRRGVAAAGAEFGAVLAFMGDHYHRAIRNQELAGLAHMSVRAFERKFHARFHLTPQKYLRKLQLRMASRALVYTVQSLAEVAVSCGFADQSHFTREFRAHFGRTPREYRDLYTKGSPPAAPGT